MSEFLASIGAGIGGGGGGGGGGAGGSGFLSRLQKKRLIFYILGQLFNLSLRSKMNY